MSDKVLIRNLQLPVLIGVYDFEREAKQRVIFEIDCHVDNRPAGLSDDVNDAVDYAKVTECVTQICEQSEYRLLEALAEHVCRDILEQFPLVKAIDLTLHKPDIMPNDVQVAIQIHRAR
ncbi:MAG: dihydroneopterin aldolase [Glaciecola sp.]|jgi:dihydroneopterin aldolase